MDREELGMNWEQVNMHKEQVGLGEDVSRWV